MKAWRIFCLVLLLCSGCRKKPLSNADSLQQAVDKGDLKQICALVARGADVNAPGSRGFTPLQTAVCLGHKRMVSLLISLGADVEARGTRGGTPLRMAVEREEDEVAAALLAGAANPDTRDKWGRTLLHDAALSGQAAFAKLLLAYGAKVDANDREGLAPLHEAAWGNHLETARLLLGHGASTASRDAEGETPLHVAARNGYKELFYLLVAQGADAQARNEKGLTPLDLLRAPPAPQVIRVHSGSDNSYSVLIANPNAVRQFLRMQRIAFDRVWIPDKRDIEALDLKTAIERSLPHNPHNSRLPPQIDDLFRHLAEYNQEYAGMIREGKKYIFCNVDSPERDSDPNSPRLSWASRCRVIVDLATGTAVEIYP